VSSYAPLQGKIENHKPALELGSFRRNPPHFSKSPASPPIPHFGQRANQLIILMVIHPITSLDDRRLDPYRHLRTSNLTRFSGRFIAESKPLVRRLLASAVEVESVLVDEKYLDEAAEWIPDSIQVYAMASPDIATLIGFQFHRGYLACGLRPPEQTWNPRRCESDWTGVLLVGVQDPENMGSILRTCAALGIQDIVIGPECVDPFARRVLRVSMGNAFKLNLFGTNHAVQSIAECHQQGIETLAACLSDSSVELAEWKRRQPTLIVLGNEAVGLPHEVIDACRRSVRIDMQLGTDSLNVSVAAAIILHYVRRLAIQ
jgi:tRNA G18 (ribose-2'-O)-methylase SpoU